MYPKFLPGDIGAVPGKGLVRFFAENLLTPKTDRFHFFIVGDYLPWDDDYVILESIGKGIAVGRLSFYEPEELEIYRVNLPSVSEDEEMLIRRMATAYLTLVGRARYDYILIAQLILSVIPMLIKGNLPPWKAEEFPYGRDKKYICTEAAAEAWLGVGYPVIPKGVAPTPSAFKQAEMDCRITRIFPNG